MPTGQDAQVLVRYNPSTRTMPRHAGKVGTLVAVYVGMQLTTRATSKRRTMVIT